MKKPESMWEFCGRLFLLLGVLFVLFGILTQAGVMRMRPGSRGGPEAFFFSGFAFLAAGIFVLFASVLRKRRKKRILKSGMSVPGTVASVEQLSYTRWNTSYPYVIRFTYEWEGVRYKGKSGLIWTPPSVKESDPLSVAIDEENPKNYALEL